MSAQHRVPNQLHASMYEDSEREIRALQEKLRTAEQKLENVREWEQTPPNRNKGHLAAFYLGHETARSEVRAILDGKEGEDEG